MSEDEDEEITRRLARFEAAAITRRQWETFVACRPGSERGKDRPTKWRDARLGAAELTSISDEDQAWLRGMALDERRRNMGGAPTAEMSPNQQPAADAELASLDSARREKSVAKCGNCQFFRGAVCLRYPPVLVSVLADVEGPIYQNSFSWPNVGAGDWCGEWKTRTSVFWVAGGAGT